MKTNGEILEEMQEQQSLTAKIQKWKTKHFCRIRKHNILQETHEMGNFLVRKNWMTTKEDNKDVMHIVGCRSYQEIKKITANREDRMQQQGTALIRLR